MLLPFSKTNDGEVYRELELGQTTKVMRNLREKEGCLELLYIKSRQFGGTKNETDKRKIKKQEQLSSLNVYILNLHFIGITIAWFSVV